MFRNYVKIAWRNIVKKKTFSIINITGLSVSVAFCLLLFFYIRHEQSYDTFHAKKDRLFRLEMSNIWAKKEDAEKEKKDFFSSLTKDNDVKNQLVFPVVVSVDMQPVFPEIKSITRFKNLGDELVRAGDEVYKIQPVMMADSNFFTNFSFRLKRGDPKTVLSSIKNAVLTESTAKRIFGNADPIGQTIRVISDSSLYTVAGIAADVPANSSIEFGMVIPVLSDKDYDYNLSERFNHSTHMYAIELADNVSADQFEQKMNRWVKTYFVEYFSYFKDIDLSKYSWHLRPVADSHYNVSSPWGHYTDVKNIYQLSCLAIIILLLAALNYVLLAISNASARSQEVGVRKVMGANRWKVIVQFWIETQVVVVLAVITGLILASLFIPLFNSALDTNISFNAFSWKEIIPSLLLLCMVLGILAGLYPAWRMSGLRPASILKSFQTFKINPGFSRVLVILQYTSCVILMISAFVINLQMNYINNKDLGFDKEQVLIVNNPTYDGDITKKIWNRLATFAESQSYIVQHTAMNGGLDGGGNHNGFQLNGEQKWLNQLTVDYNYFDMLKLEFVKGRPFSKNIPSDTIKKARACVVNETLWNMLGKDAKLDVYNEAIRSTIIGVVKDYHYETLTKKIEAQQHILASWYVGSFMFKVRAGQMQHAISSIEKEWKQVTGNFPFEYTFLDQNLAKLYDAQQRWKKAIQASGFFAILIACMGLFGLSAINAANRVKEIGIRKVLGASVRSITATLSSSFLVMASVSILIATPVAYWMMNKWLEDFVYRITISWWMFVVVGIVALLIALATVSFQAIKAALANPVDSLRSE